MQEYSKRMLSAGWVFHSKNQNHWEMLSPENLRFTWEDGVWQPELSEVLQELEKNETAIRDGYYSPFTGTSRLTVPQDDSRAGLLTQWLVEQNKVKGMSILRARACLDPTGDELLYQAGARRVETLLQPWTAAPNTQRHLSSHLLICEHVLDVLPKSDRPPTLKRIISHLAEDAEAYFSFYQMGALPLSRPHESLQDGYVFTYGPHKVFLKPSLPGQVSKGIQNILGGFAEEVNLLYDEIFCRWFPHV